MSNENVASTHEEYVKYLKSFPYYDSTINYDEEGDIKAINHEIGLLSIFTVYGKGKTIDLDDGSRVDISILSDEVQEFHYLPQSSYKNWYQYDENGNLELIVNYYGDIELYRTTYDTFSNLLTEEKGAVWDAPFSLEQVKSLSPIYRNFGFEKDNVLRDQKRWNESFKLGRSMGVDGVENEGTSKNKSNTTQIIKDDGIPIIVYIPKRPEVEGG